jgi:hypothetical protein
MGLFWDLISRKINYQACFRWYKLPRLDSNQQPCEVYVRATALPRRHHRVNTTRRDDRNRGTALGQSPMISTAPPRLFGSGS